MDRREALRRTALMMGGMISAPTIIGILNGCTAKPTLNWKPVFFTENQGMLVSRLAEIIIPKTDTPGANDVGIPAFIETMIKDVYAEKDRAQFMSGLAAFDAKSDSESGDPFNELDEADQTAFVKKQHDAAQSTEEDKRTEDQKFLMIMKELTVVGYFTSEVGATKVLQYEAVPGAYHGCLPLKETGTGKAWAT